MGEVSIPEHLDPATQVKYRSVCRKYGVLEGTNWGDIRAQVLSTRKQNTRRSDIIALRTILGSEGSPPIPNPVRKAYEVLSPETILERSKGKYQGYVLAMAFAGLRIGEAVALSSADVKRVGERCFIEVSQSRQNTGRYKQPKSGSGRVAIPEWLYEELVAFDYPEILPNSLYKYLKRRGIQPHGLRHIYATMLVRQTKNVELVRRQLRHSSLTTTLSVYVEIEASDELELIAALPNPKVNYEEDDYCL